MPDQRAARVAELVKSAIERGPEARGAFLDKECRSDPVMRAEIESLLQEDKGAGGFLDEPALHVAAETFVRAGAFQAGQTIGDYEIISLIGSGGMGEVYLAEDWQLHRKVALKLVRRGMASEDMIHHFKREAHLLASLNHPNIAQLYGGGVSADGIPFFAMEYVEGERLDQYCDERRLPPKERLELFRKVCSAVTYAHQHLVIHRDLKPANIRVTAEGEPKLLDFGIAKLLDAEDAQSAGQTLTLQGVMTPEVASPEQVAGGSITTASDVYSLGVVLYRLLTGQSPYRTKTNRPDEIARAITEQEPTRPSAAVRSARESRFENRDSADSPSTVHDSRSLRGDVDNIVLMALRKEPSRRHASVGQFSEDIRRYLEGLPVLAHKDTLAYRAGKFVSRNKIGVAASAVVALALVGGLAAALWQADAARRERDVANVERLKAMRINEFLQQMLSFSNQSVYSVAPVAQTKNVTVNQMLDEIAPRIETELADQSEVRAQILRTIASAYASQGIYDKAEKNYRSALETQRRIFGADHAETAATMTQFGILAFRQGKIAEADQLLENAVAFYRRQKARQAPDFSAVNLVTAMNFLGAVRMTAINLQSGGAIMEEALQIAENAHLQGNERFALAAVQGDVGLYLARAGELERADRLLRESLAIHRQLSEYPRWEMGATLASLGELYNRKNQPDQALEFLLESEWIYRQTLGYKNRYLAFNLQHQAIALSLQKNFTDAEPKARQQLAIYLEVVPENKSVAAIPKSVLGIVLVGIKQFDEAEAYLREGLQGLEQSPVKNHFINVHAKIALSQCLLNQNRLAEAEQFALAAHAEARQNLGEQDPHVKAAAESLSKIHERQGNSK